MTCVHYNKPWFGLLYFYVAKTDRCFRDNYYRKKHLNSAIRDNYDRNKHLNIAIRDNYDKDIHLNLAVYYTIFVHFLYFHLGYAMYIDGFCHCS